MLPIKFRLNSTYSLGGDVVWRISRWPPLRPSWISERKDFSKSESLCRSDASHQVSAQSYIRVGEVSWKKNHLEYRNGTVLFSNSESLWRLLGYRNGRILTILNLYVALMLPTKFRLNVTYGLGEDVVWRISRWPPKRPSWIPKRSDFNNSESLCHCDSSHQVLAQSDLRFGRRCHLKNFKMAAMAKRF